MAVLRNGTLLKHGTFIIVSMLGRGGFGEVYLARQPRMDREVAIKVLSPNVADDEEIVKRFQREALAAASLLHPNVLPVFDFDFDDEADTWFLAMQYIPGGRTLKDLLGTPLGLPRTVRLTQAIASALDAAHDRGIIHRDVKPPNVLLDGERPILTDFGIAHLGALTGITATGLAMGTPAYMSPEQAMAREVGKASDQYSLAVMVYEMLSGRQPFTGDSFSLVMQHVNAQPPSLPELNPEIPPGIAAAVTRALSKTPSDRFGSCGEFADALAEAVPGLFPSTGGRSVSPVSPSSVTQDVPLAETLGSGAIPISAEQYFQPSVAVAEAAAQPSAVAEPIPAPPLTVPPWRRPLFAASVGALAVVLVGGLLAARAALGPPETLPGAAPATAAPPTTSGTVLPDASVARVALSSNPNASIYIDGEPAGRTPATLSLKPGQHDLRLIAKTFEEWTRRIVVTEDGQAVPPGAADGPPRTVVATGESQSIPAELVPQRAIEVLRVIGKDVGKDPFVDAAKMIRVATRTDNFRVADDVNAIAYIQPETHEVRDIAFKLTMRWHRAGGLEPYEQTGEQRISRDWDQTFIRACAPATSLDGRGSGEPLKVELVVDDQILAEFSFTISGGSLADAPPTQCQNTNLPSSQAALPVLLPLASPGWLG